MDKDLNSNINLDAVWKKMADEKFSNSKIEKQNIMNAIKLQSTSDIVKLKKRLGDKILWVVFFIVSFLVLILFNFKNTEVRFLMGIAVIVYLLAGILLYYRYRQMGATIDKDLNVLDTMKSNLSSIKSALNSERIWGMFIVPLAVPFGMTLSRVLNGATISETIANPELRMKALILVCIITPIMFLVTEKMNKSAYGKLMKDLETNIIKMETLS